MRLENSFILAPGIGETTEQDLWSRGVTHWDDIRDRDVLDGRRDAVEEFLDKAEKNLSVGNSLFFDHHLPRDAVWRLYENFRDETCFFDIETTGLDRDRDVVTTVSFHQDGETETLVRGQDLDGDRIADMFFDAKVIVSFNGKRFDVPFLEEKFDVEIETPHIDLLYLCRRLGLTGGLKRIEEELGVDREMDDVDGREAIHLWKRYEKSGDEAALDKLVEYNKLDVINLKPLLEDVHGRLRGQVFEPHVNGS